MSGIVGFIGSENAVSVMIDALAKLEHRGYDSCGIAVLYGTEVTLRKELGGIKHLENSVSNDPVSGTMGIGHTRWATHGKVSIENAHPQVAGDVVLVHNGIIENHFPLRDRLLGEGREFISSTDTEVLAHLIDLNFNGNLRDAVSSAVKELEGKYALAAFSASDPDKIVTAAKGISIAIGLGTSKFIIASDVTAILPHTPDVIFLSDGDLAVVTREGVTIQDSSGREVLREIKKISWNSVMVEKGGYRNFFLKEVCEQPRSVHDTTAGRFSGEAGVYFKHFSLSEKDFRSIQRVLISGCGTSWYAGLIGKYMVEEIVGIPCDVELSSEFRDSFVSKTSNTLVVGVSQSGETADTIESIRKAAENGAITVGITNAYSSILERAAGGNIHIHAGPEISVAATKSFTSSLVALYMLSIYLAQGKNRASGEKLSKLMDDLRAIPQSMEKVIELEESVELLSRLFYNKKGFMYLARGILYPIACEGAMKMKSLAYTWAEGFAGGEVKHGPIALVDQDTPVVVLIPNDRHYQKSLNDAEEVKTRGGIVIVFATEGDDDIARRFDHVIYIPKASYCLNPLLFAIPLQLLAYFVAIRRGCNVDRPRNLAKSVTVE